MPNRIHYFCVLLLCGIFANAANAKNCEEDNLDLQSMLAAEMTAVRDDESVFKFAVRVADNVHTRAAGFQRVCDSGVRLLPILFLFESETTPRFHMRNVVAPLDIAFVHLDGSIDSIQAMAPYKLMSKDRPLYSPAAPVIAALEGHLGFFAENRITSSSTLSWKLNDPK